MKRRVVVTGIGAVSPNGIGREAFWEATRSGISGVKRISRFDASQFAALNIFALKHGWDSVYYFLYNPVLEAFEPSDADF